MTSTRALVATAAGAALLIGLTGCTAAGGSASGSAAASGGRVPLAASAPQRAASDSVAAAAGVPAPKAAAARDIVRTGTLDLTAKDPVAAADRIGALVDGAAGHLDADAVHPGHAASADLTVRIPADVFDTTLAAIERTGTVRSVSLHAADVTAQVTDDSVRIAALQASVARLTTLLGRASDTSDLVSLEGALTSRQSDLQSLQAQQRGLDDQVSYATLAVTISTPAAVPVYRPGTFASGFAGGSAALAATGAWLAVAIGVLAPWVLVLAVLTAAALVIVRLARRRRGGAAPSPDAAG